MAPREKRLPQPVRADSLATQTFHILKEAIFAGKFQPGEPVLEMHIAKSLEVSQATVREALGLLEQSGLVVRTPGRKTTVTSLTTDDVRDRLSIRIALEEIACEKAASRMPDTGFRELDKLAKAIRASVESNDCLKMTLDDFRFHRFIWERSETPILLRTLDQITTPLFAFLGGLHAKDSHNLQMGKRHEAIVDALRTRNPEIARRAMREHIQDSYRSFLEPERAARNAARR